MVKNKKIMTASVCAFLLVEAVLTVLIQVDRVTEFRYLTFPVVVLACLFNLIFLSKKRNFILTECALVCTVVADVFLLWLDTGYVIGVSFFILVQLLYAARIYLSSDGAVLGRVHLAVRCALSLAAVTVPCIILGERVDALSVLSVVCFVNLVLNVVFSFIDIKKNAVLPIALALFMLCDLIVGFMNIGPYFSISSGSFGYFLIQLGARGAWLFYAPSQALLAVSLMPDWLKQNGAKEDKKALK